MSSKQKEFLAKASRCMPELAVVDRNPASLAQFTMDQNCFQGYSTKECPGLAEMNTRPIRQDDSFILDFGEHLVGYFSFNAKPADAPLGAPLRLQLVFAETPAECTEPLDTFTGKLCRSWIQDEVINIDALPATIEMPRRYAFRFVKITVIASPGRVIMSGFTCKTVTSATGSPILPKACRENSMLGAIFEASLKTLKNCMQTVFEDGPKRDRRLWMGDLRLQALANYHSFRNMDLVKRCLYLFAALPCQDGLVSGAVYETPEPVSADTAAVDYAALFIPALLEYAIESGDQETAADLYPVALKQVELLSQYVSREGRLLPFPRHYWPFVDWNNTLDRSTPTHAILLYCLTKFLELAESTGNSGVTGRVRELTSMMHTAARAMINPDTGLPESQDTRQVSAASAAWFTIAGIYTRDEAAAALKTVRSSPSAIAPVTPYLYHYLVEAMFISGLHSEATQVIIDYWGGMIRKGASCFWEVYDPCNDYLSPYGDHRINSYCHAWSCTPVYLISRYIDGLEPV